MANIVYLKIALFIFLTISILCLIATHAEILRQLTLRLFNILYAPFFNIGTWCRQAYSAIIGWMKKQISAETEQNDNQHAIYYLAGCLLYGCFTALFLYCDLGLIIQSIEAIGFSSSLKIVEPATVMAISMVASTLAWGAIFFDALEITHLAPCFGRLSCKGKKALTVVSATFFVVSLMSLLSLTYWRADVIATSMVPDANAASSEIMTTSNLSETANLEDLMSQLDQDQMEVEIGDLPPIWIIYAAIILSGLSVIVCTMVCFTACIPLIKWLVLGLCMILMVPMFAVWAISTLIALIVDALSGFARNFLDLLVDIGNSILEKFPRSETNRVNTQENRTGNYSNHRDDSISEKEKKSSENSSPDEEPNEASINEVNSSKMGFDPFG